MIMTLLLRLACAFALLAACGGSATTPSRPRPPRTHPLDDIAQRIRHEHRTPKARAIAAFNFVRDEIRFGFTSDFDDASVSQTLARRRGHANPQGALFVALLNKLDIAARQHFVILRNDLLYGLFPTDARLPKRIAHGYVELTLNELPLKLDGYIVSPRYFANVRARLKREGRQRGYGAAVDGCVHWDGESDCRVQFTASEAVLSDEGSYPQPRVFLDSDRNPQRLNWVTRKVFTHLGIETANRRIEAMRQAAPPEAEPEAPATPAPTEPADDDAAPVPVLDAPLHARAKRVQSPAPEA